MRTLKNAAELQSALVNATQDTVINLTADITGSANVVRN